MRKGFESARGTVYLRPAAEDLFVKAAIEKDGAGKPQPLNTNSLFGIAGFSVTIEAPTPKPKTSIDCQVEGHQIPERNIDMSSPTRSVNQPPVPQYMLPSDVRSAFERLGWVPYSGDLYFNGAGTTTHPHLHLKTSSQFRLVRVDRDIRLAVTMLAWSDGGQGRGGGGTTFIRDGNVRIQDWEDYIDIFRMSRAMADEFSWIMDYFTRG